MCMSGAGVSVRNDPVLTHGEWVSAASRHGILSPAPGLGSHHQPRVAEAVGQGLGRWGASPSSPGQLEDSSARDLGRGILRGAGWLQLRGVFGKLVPWVEMWGRGRSGPRASSLRPPAGHPDRGLWEALGVWSGLCQARNGSWAEEECRPQCQRRPGISEDCRTKQQPEMTVLTSRSLER